MRSRPKVVFPLLAAGALAYGAGLLVIWRFADRIMFRPQSRQRELPAELFALRAPSGTTVSAVYLESPDADYTVLFSHGNAEDLEDVLPFLRQLQEHGFSVMAYDYPGYGRSGGKVSAWGAVEAAKAAYDWLVREKGVSPDRLILHGFSIGGGPATIVATDRPCAGLVLEGTFTATHRVLTRIAIFPFDHFNNKRRIVRLTVPVLVIHGRKDRTVPFRHGQELYAAARTPKLFLAVDHGGHTNLHQQAGEDYWRAWQDFARLLATTAAAEDQSADRLR